MVANYIPVRCNQEGQFQYAVSFSPEVHSKNMRYKLLYSQSSVIGHTRNFDGTILFLPVRLAQEVRLDWLKGKGERSSCAIVEYDA